MQKRKRPQLLSKLLFKKIRLTNTPIHALDTATWFHIRDEFNASVGGNYNMRIILGRVLYLRNLYDKLKPQIEARLKERKSKKLRKYARLCTIFESPKTEATKLQFIFRELNKHVPGPSFSFTDCRRGDTQSRFPMSSTWMN